MAKVLIQEGVKRFQQKQIANNTGITNTEKFRSALEAQEPRRLRGAPRKIKLIRPTN